MYVINSVVKDLLKKNILTLPRLLKQGVAFFADLIICAVTVWIAFGLRVDQWGLLRDYQWLAFLAASLFSIPLFVACGLYRSIFRFVGSVAFSSIVKVFVVYSFLYAGVFTIIGVNDIPRSIGVIQPILFFFGIGLSRYFIRTWLGSKKYSYLTNHLLRPRVLIYGAQLEGRQLASSLLIDESIKLIGFIDDDSQLHGKTIDGTPVYPEKDIKKLISHLKVSNVFLALPFNKQDHRKKIISELSGCGVRVLSLPSVLDMAIGKLRFDDLYKLDMNDLLDREVVPANPELLKENIYNKTVLVTGAGGSIGSEICRQALKLSPKSIILVDTSEHSLYLVYQELKNSLVDLSSQFVKPVANSRFDETPSNFEIKLVPCLASVRDFELMSKILSS